MFTKGQREQFKILFQELLPDEGFTDQQTLFFNNMFDLVLTDVDTSHVTTVPARCGIGKSTFVKVFISLMISDIVMKTNPTGMVIITDSVARLSSIADISDIKEKARGFEALNEDLGWGYSGLNIDSFSKRVAILTSDQSLTEQLDKQRYKPIVLLTTQRYFRMDAETREQLFHFKWKDKEYERRIILCDEKPYFSEVIDIGISNINNIATALQEGLTDKVEDKQWVCEQFERFRDYFIKTIEDKEALRPDKNLCLYHRPERQTITEEGDDERFLKIIFDNRNYLYPYYNDILRDLRLIQNILSSGAWFMSKKIRDKESGNKYSKCFERTVDHRDAFYLNTGRKFFVFDATADIDPAYKNRDYIIPIRDSKIYCSPINLTITVIDETTSKSKLNNIGEATKVVKRVRNYLEDQQMDKDDAVVLTYKAVENKFEDYKYHGHFGALKGVNDFRDLHQMAHVGLFRKPTLTYFIELCAIYPEYIQEIQRMSEEESLDYLDKISTMKIPEVIEPLRNYIAKSLVTDFEQNVFRLAIRNYGTEEVAHVHLFYHYSNNSDKTEYSLIMKEIEKRFMRYENVRIVPIGKTIDAQIDKIMDRKNGKESNAQKIMKWIETIPKGESFKVAHILKGTDLNNSEFQKAKEKNQELSSVLAKMKDPERKGWYIKR